MGRKNNLGNAPVDVRSLARVHTRSAIKTLAGIMNEPRCRPADRINASEALLNRGWGNMRASDADSAPAKIMQEIKLLIVDARHNDTKIVDVEPVLIEHKPVDEDG
jgi:hypothetical protein